MSKDLEGLGGLYTEGCSVSSQTPENSHPAEYGYAKWAFDPVAEERLFKVSREILGIKE